MNDLPWLHRLLGLRGHRHDHLDEAKRDDPQDRVRLRGGRPRVHGVVLAAAVHLAHGLGDGQVDVGLLVLRIRGDVCQAVQHLLNQHHVRVSRPVANLAELANPCSKGCSWYTAASQQVLQPGDTNVTAEGALHASQQQLQLGDGSGSAALLRLRSRWKGAGR